MYIKMDKLFVLIYLSPCFIKLGVVRLFVFFVLLCKLPESYENKRFRVYCTSRFKRYAGFCVVLEKKMLK